MYQTEVETEDERTMWRRRLQQRRCLVCGSRQLVNSATSYFCPQHIGGWRYCSRCETLRTKKEHGNDWRCRRCANTLALAYYYENRERTIYRIRLKQIGERSGTRGDQIFLGIRRRIALADLVARTPGLSWSKRAAIGGGYAKQLATNYRRQLRGPLLDEDSCDQARTRKRTR